MLPQGWADVSLWEIEVSEESEGFLKTQSCGDSPPREAYQLKYCSAMKKNGPLMDITVSVEDLIEVRRRSPQQIGSAQNG